MALPIALAAQDALPAITPAAWPKRPSYEIWLTIPPMNPLAVGKPWHMRATPVDSVNNRYAWPVHWHSSDTKVLTVKSTGDSTATLVGRRIGRAVLTASAGPAVTSVIIYVGVLPPPVKIDVVPARGRIHVGDQIRLLAQPWDSLGRRLPGLWLHWTWTDSSLVRLMGMPSETEVIVTALAPGEVTMTSTLGDRTGRATIQIVP